MLDPDIIIKYYNSEDYLLLGAYYKAPPGRILRKQWKINQKNFPSFL